MFLKGYIIVNTIGTDLGNSYGIDTYTSFSYYLYRIYLVVGNQFAMMMINSSFLFVIQLKFFAVHLKGRLSLVVVDYF